MDGKPGYLRGRTMLAAAEGLAGDAEAAKRHLAEYAAIERNMTISTVRPATFLGAAGRG
jgi:hypothetical protein